MTPHRSTAESIGSGARRKENDMAAIRFFLAWYGNMTTADGSVVRREGFTNYSHRLGDVATIGDKGKRGKGSAVEHYNLHASGRGLAPACIVQVSFPKNAPAAMPFLTLKGCDKVSTKNVGSVEALVTKYGATVEAVAGSGTLPKALQTRLDKAKAKAEAEATKAKAETKAETKASTTRKAGKAKAKAETKVTAEAGTLSADAVRAAVSEMLAGPTE
jgi:hypothetical protein